MKSMLTGLLLTISLVANADILSVYYLYRQSPYTQEATYPVINNYGYSWAGGCLSCSTQNFQFGYTHPYASKALFIMQWICKDGQNSVEVISFDNGPANIDQIAVISCSGEMNAARPGWAVITTDFNQLVMSGATKNIGYRIKGNPANPPLILDVKLEVYWGDQ